MIKNLRLQNFRSYTEKSFNFSQGVNIIVGPNAIGKTNVLEAVLLSRIGNSYRAKDIDLVSFNKPWARVDSEDDGNKRIIKIETHKSPAKTIEINGRVYKRLPPGLKLPVVLFEPNHLQLLNGSPEGRRAYLDSFIDQIDDNYGPLLRKYNRTVAQRNSLLKSPVRPSSNQLFPWNIRVSQLGGQIVRSREQLIKDINKTLPSVYRSLSVDKVETLVEYKPQLPPDNYESNYLKKLETSLEDDLRMGFTSVGPHRDDFSFMFDNHPSNTYASRGELRTAILALKITELETLKRQEDLSPIMLLDDVYSELDIERRKGLTTYLRTCQSFITTTDADLMSKQLVSKSVVIKL